MQKKSKNRSQTKSKNKSATRQKTKPKTIPELKPEQRPDEKCLAFGPEALTDAELLAILLRTGTIEETSVDLAGRILDPENGQPGSLLNLLDRRIEDLQEIKGIGRVKALKIKAVAELSKRIAMTKAEEKLDFSMPESVAGYYMEQLRHCGKEQVILILLDAGCRKIRDLTLSVGTVNCSLISPREVIREALQYNAVNLILLHNHPSGDPTPSKADLAVTKRVKKACAIMDLALLDHIIVGDNTYYSMKEEGTAV